MTSCSQAVNKSPTHYPCDSARTFRVILFSIHNDEWKSFQCHHQTALRRLYALSWKPCQGDSLNLPDHRIHKDGDGDASFQLKIHKDGDGDASFQLKSDSLPHAHAQTTKTFYKHQDSRIMKAQELNDKVFRTNSDIQDLPSKISSLSREIVNMDDPNITMEEYVRLEEEKAHSRGKVFDWKTAKYGKIWYDEDVHDLRSIETEFPAIAFNDQVSSEKTISYEPTVSSLNDEIDFRISFEKSNDED
ncbi:hypothetical protein Tco_0276464 [Tanacetum coccineum]